MSLPGQTFEMTAAGSSSKDKGDSSNVQVIVRVRPLNDREKQAKSSICVTYNSDAQLTVFKDAGGKRANERPFTFDRVFNEQSTQMEVFTATAKNTLEKAFSGLNVTIFAYGQTGSGKTFTMQGTPAAPGIIPLLCEELFRRISATPAVDFYVKASYLEIYQEQLRDLMDASPNSDALQIRQDTIGGRGIYVQNLTEHEVATPDQVLALINQGTARRTVGETNMNAVSSRSHAVFTLVIEQRDKNDKEGYTLKTSKLNLIDLAGSERAESTGATGQRLKEGAGINQSLSALGNVINALVSSAGHVPYRDSKLTRILQDSLGGNSVCLMIANMSPATVNFDESLSTLRFADRAKQIKNKAVINRDPKSAKIAELLEENARLRQRIAELEAELAKEKGIPTIDEPEKQKKCCCVIC